MGALSLLIITISSFSYDSKFSEKSPKNKLIHPKPSICDIKLTTFI